jgi:tRNA dimethylallyltransferase
MDSKPRLIVLLGPTAVGKTETALQLTERLNGEIISADSRLFYRGLDIGTAKPSEDERLRIPHHLIDVATPDQPWSLALFQREARRAIAAVHERGRLPFLVGGTGQYLRAVTEEWEVPPAQPDARLRAALEDWTKEIGPQGLHERLAILDPGAAKSIDARNLRRTVRALEVIFQTGRRFSDQRRRSSSPYNLLQLGLIRPRPELYARVDARIVAMLAAGLVDEVKGLLAQGYSPDLPALSAIGYREIIAYLMGEISLGEAEALIKRNTRIYIRRQANWFKANDPEIRWFQAGIPGVEDEMEELIRKWLEREKTVKSEQ